jgi:Rab3 GTPase-activating protein catalytic subunit
VESRIDAAHRFQRPKLISDMSAFKAANPGCLFHDFISWYGNPENPLTQFNQTSVFDCMHPKDCTGFEKGPEDEAFEALFILNATREFWTACWEEAKPISALDQKPLFDAFSTVEMLLLWFESMHPAILINQVVAVNIAMANFILQTSNSCSNIRPIREALERLEEKSRDALERLSKDIVKNFSEPVPVDNSLHSPFVYISPETIKLCESICALIGNVEMLQSRAISLLSKLNLDEKLVSMILEAPEGRNFSVTSHQSREGILQEIFKQHKNNNRDITDSTTTVSPSPSVREYVLRKNDDTINCQLTVCIGGTFGLEQGETNSTKGGLVLALKRGSR